MNHFILTIGFVLFISINTLHAKEVSKVCQDFVKSPKNFKMVETSKIEEKEFFNFDLDSDGAPEECAYEDSGGTCHTDMLSCSGGYLNTKSDGMYFGYDEIGVEYKGSLYNFLSGSRRDVNKVEVIGEISKKGTTILCDIKQKIIDISTTNVKLPVCEAILTGKIARIKINDPKIRTDLQRNGSYITYSKDGYSSGAGCGCSTDSTLAESTNPNDKAFINAFNKLNSNEPSCSGKTLPLTWSVVRFNKKDFLFLENPGLKKGSLISAHKRLQPQTLYEWNGSSFSEVCSNSYKTEVVAVEPELE